MQEKVLAQLEKEPKKAPAKPEGKANLAAPKAGGLATAATEDEEEEEEDPVEAALTKYGIITENPWEKGVKYAKTQTRTLANTTFALHQDIITSWTLIS